ncbi:hypothetical protein GGU11DRAFT_811209 [Lentinula aff. detonsa]|nr:hypothetical protein GGU11DRAFT_811209 [Lentinula aff. detonsa]
MGGDHKCPVCSATFTRPQHVVRHMRSHTGDRPYKCQHCGDQFSRSDLLSRHINKCHVGEKLSGGTVSNDTHGRRKGPSANATRATTSKQACDQCVQSSLPCDGCNPCAKCVQRKIRCTFVKFHRQTAPIGPGHNQNRSSNSSSSPSLHPSPPQQAPTFNPPSNPYGPVYGSYDPSVSSLNYPSHHGAEDDPFVLHPAPGSSSYAASYRAQQSDLHRRASLPSFSVPGGQPWIGGWHESSQNGEGGPSPVPFTVETGNHFAFNVGNDYRDQSFTLRHPHAQHSHQPPYSHPSQPQHNSHTHPNASSTTSLNSYSSSSSSSHDSRPGTASDTSSLAEDPPSRPGTSSSFADSLSGSRPGTSGSGSVHEHSGNREHRNNTGFSNAFGLLSLDDPAVIAGLANDGAPFFSHLNHIGVDTQLNTTTGSTAMPLDSVATVGTGLAFRNDPDATPMPIGEAQAMGLVGPGVGPNPASIAASATSSHQHHHFPRSRPSTGHGRSSNWTQNAVGDVGTPGRETETRELREFWKAYMRTPLSGPGGAAGGMLGAPHPDAHMFSPGGTLHAMNSSTSPYRRQRVSSLPSVKTPTAVSDEERYAAGFVGFNGPYGPKYPQQQPPPPLLLPSYRNNAGYTNHQLPENVQYPAVSGNASTMHGNAEDLRSYEAAVMARKAPVNLSMEGLGGKMRRKAANDSNTRMTTASASASPNLSSATQSQGSGSSPSSGSSADSSPAIPQSLPPESVLRVEGGDSASRRPSFKRGASQVLEKGGSGKLARRTSSSRYDSLDHEYDYGEQASLLSPFEAPNSTTNLFDSPSMPVFGVEADNPAGLGGLQATAST